MSDPLRPRLLSEIAHFYEETPEEERLSVGRSRLEFARTKEILLRYLPDPPAVLLDVGGGAGPYSLWLAGLGFEVHLVDPVPRLVEEARRRSEASKDRIRSCAVGDARRLEFAEGAADAVLLLGPLYHLTEATERLLALHEARRVLRPGGVLFAAAISRYASALDGVSRDLLADPRFAAIVRQDLEGGQHRNETEDRTYFTTAYFHRPEDLRSEVEAAGLACRALVGIEGPGWVLSDFDERWADSRKREDLVRVARALESEPSIIGLSAHLLAVGVK